MFTYVKTLKAIWNDDGAVTALEYAILAGLVSAGIAGIFSGWGVALAGKLTRALGT